MKGNKKNSRKQREKAAKNKGHSESDVDMANTSRQQGDEAEPAGEIDEENDALDEMNPPSGSNEDDLEDDGEVNNKKNLEKGGSSDGNTSGESYGKRKVDDFLRKQAQAMDSSFKASAVLPGDDVTEMTTRSMSNIRLGPGLIQHDERVVATRAGMLRYRPPCSYWVESNGRRYCGRVEDQVLGIVEDRMGESYKVSIFGSSPALLGMLEFNGATKRSKPNIKNGALVFCRVASADKDMEVELTCTSTHHGSKKDWMTGESTFGELKGGKMQRCSLLLAKSLTKPRCRVLYRLAKHMPFEIAAGLNGAFWVDSGSEAHTIVICNAILNSEMMTDDQTDAMVDQLANHLKE